MPQYFFFPAKPQIVQKPVDQIVTRGGNVTFNCVAEGYPKPALFWEFKGKAMFPMQHYGRLFISSEGQLQIKGVKREDEGVYRCSALSSVAGLGASSAEARLTIKGMNIKYLLLVLFFIK